MERQVLLIKNDRELTRSILYLLNNPSVAKQFGKNGIKYIQEKFDYRLNAKQWLELFIDIDKNRRIEKPPVKNNYFYQGKLIKEGIRILRSNVPLLHNIPSLIEVKSILKKAMKK